MSTTPRLQGLPPVLGRGTRLPVLGSVPGVASLLAQQTCAHPRHQFCPLLGAIWGTDLKHVAAPGCTVPKLPSTSPAHARWNLERKHAAWRAAVEQAGLLDMQSPTPNHCTESE